MHASQVAAADARRRSESVDLHTMLMVVSSCHMSGRDMMPRVWSVRLHATCVVFKFSMQETLGAPGSHSKVASFFG